jgi:hypothetical protein
MSKDVPSYDDRNGKRENLPPGAPRLPTMTVTFDPETQAVGLKFEPSEFRSWDMVVATLEMAKSFAEFNRNMVRMQAVQQQQMAAQQEVAIRNKIKL